MEDFAETGETLPDSGLEWFAIGVECAEVECALTRLDLLDVVWAFVFDELADARCFAGVFAFAATHTGKAQNSAGSASARSKPDCLRGFNKFPQMPTTSRSETGLAAGSTQHFRYYGFFWGTTPDISAVAMPCAP